MLWVLLLSFFHVKLFLLWRCRCYEYCCCTSSTLISFWSDVVDVMSIVVVLLPRQALFGPTLSMLWVLLLCFFHVNLFLVWHCRCYEYCCCPSSTLTSVWSDVVDVMSIVVVFLPGQALFGPTLSMLWVLLLYFFHVNLFLVWRCRCYEYCCCPSSTLTSFWSYVVDVMSIVVVLLPR